MLTLIMLFALQVTTTAEMTCMDSVLDIPIPSDLYIAGVQLEGVSVMSSQGQLVYLNGPRTNLLQVGAVERVVRPEGRIRGPLTGAGLGIYYRDMGTIRIEAVDEVSATARVLVSCDGMIKGDLVIPYISKPPVQFSGDLSNALTPVPDHGLTGSILLGKNDFMQLAAGQFCFVDLGARDGIRAGDRLTVFRQYPAFNPRDMAISEPALLSSYSSVHDWASRHKESTRLHARILPPMILGDIVVVEATDKVSVGKIVNSLSEIYPGDCAVKR